MKPKDDPPRIVKPSRILLKVSGEGLGADGLPLHEASIDFILQQIVDVREVFSIQIALVVGGGNILRGAQQTMLGRTTGDFAGMVATIINGLALKDKLQSLGVTASLQSALPMDQLADPILPDRALSSLHDGGVVVFVGGTGNPYVTTDSAAAIRAGQIDADLILKGTNVRGAFTADPAEGNAEFIPSISYRELFRRQLEIIDLSAAKIAQESGIPMVIFDLSKENALSNIVEGKKVGSYVYPESSDK